jgi:hypothetical protein
MATSTTVIICTEVMLYAAIMLLERPLNYNMNAAGAGVEVQPGELQKRAAKCCLGTGSSNLALTKSGP